MRSRLDRSIPALPRVALSLVLGTTACTSDEKKASTADASATSLESDAFVWGFPLVVTHRTLQTFAGLFGVNNLFNQAALTTAAIRLVVAPNQDTLYSVAVVDLRSEPMVLTVPDDTTRYWTYQFVDGWTNSFHYVGTRATAGRGGSFAIVPPGYTGTLPSTVTRVDSPTPVMFLLGRYLYRGSADPPITSTLVPLSTITGATPPPAPPPLGTAIGTPNLTGTTGATFFNELGDALAVNGPSNQEDKDALGRFEAIGIGPGLHPVPPGGQSGQDTRLADAVINGQARLDAGLDRSALERNGWRIVPGVGIYTSDFLLRATVAKYAWGANVPEEAVYPVSLLDSAGNPYDGTAPYVMHFAQSELPPVDPTLGFWSVTLYGSDMYFVENSIRRYAIGDRTPGLTYNADGSLDLFIQSTAPVGREGNWLPSPGGDYDSGATTQFRLIMRLYLPSAAVLDGQYTVPPVVPP